MKLRMVPINQATRLFDPVKQRRAIENALSAAALGVQTDFGVTTRTFSTRPRFTIKKGTFRRTISTSSEIYGYVTRGTRPHVIRPRRARALRFQSGYQRKSIPRVIASRSGGSFGPVVYSQEVHHPGTEGTHVDQKIADKWERQWPITLQRSIAAEF